MRISYPGCAIPAPGGGAWITEPNRPAWRWLDELLVRLDPKETPLAHRTWSHVGVTRSGGVWVMVQDYHGGAGIFLRRARPKEAMPKVRVKELAVKYRRHVMLTWDMPSQGVTAAVWRVGPDDYWHVLDTPAYERFFEEPGKHVIELEARALDELGLPGPPAIQRIEVDVRLPRTRWLQPPPECIEDLVWVVPVDAEWTDPDVPRRIEWRVAGQEWKPLAEDRRVPVAQYNNRAVPFEFRAVEEDSFIDPKPLSVKVAVEMSLEKVIRRRIDRILHGTETERNQAIEDLKTVPEEAQEYLQQTLDELIQAERRCRDALEKI